MAQYTAATAAVNIVPRIGKKFHEQIRAAIGNTTYTVKVVPDFQRMATPKMAPIPVNVQPNLDNAALARIEQALRAISKIQLDADSSAAEQKIAALRARLETLRDQVINLKVSDTQAKAEMALIKRELDSIDRMDPSIDVQVDAGAASAALGRVDAEVSRLSGQTARVAVDADIGSALSGLAALTSALWAVNQMSVRPHVNVDVSSAIASIARLTAMIMALGGLGGVVGGLAGALGGIGAAGAVAAGGLGAALLAFRGIGDAVKALGAQQDQAGQKAAQSAKQQQAAAFAIQNAQAGVAAASSKASQARQDAARTVGRAEQESARSIAAAELQVESAKRSVNKAIQAAGRARVNAAESVARAEQQAARQIESAERAVASAKRREAQATRDLERDQRALTTAWEDGRRSLQDLQDQLDDTRIDQRQAVLDLRDAERDLAAARRSGNAEDIERAQIAYDRQVESMDQLQKRAERLTVDNQRAQAAGVAGTQQVIAANERVQASQQSLSDARQASALAERDLDRARVDGAASVAAAQRQAAQQVADADARVLDAQIALGTAQTKLTQARLDGAQRIADAQREGAQQIADADRALIASQRALAQAMARTGDEGAGAADKVAQAFANLSPAAAAFARYLFGLKPVLDQLSATAAAGLFPPLQQGIDALLTKLPLINTVVGQLAAGLGAGLKLALEQLTNPFWTGFFTAIGNAAATVIPRFFQSLMLLAQAAGQLVLAFLPFADVGLGVLDMLSALIGNLAGPLAQALVGMIPAAQAFIGALGFLGPLLQALSPILNALGVAVSQVLGAALQALTPILIALTPFIQYLAQALAEQLVSAIQALTPFLVGLAGWMSRNPALVMGLVGAVLAAIPVFNAFGAVFSFLFGPVALLRIAMLATGASLTGLLAPLGGVFAKLGSLLGIVGRATSITGIFGTILRGLGGAVMGLGRMVLGALGPIGWIITAFGLMYATSQPFRDAINQILGILMQLVGQIIGAVMPIFQALSGAFSMIAGVAGQLVGQLAMALVPVIQVVASVLSQLVSAVLPPLMSIVQALVPIINLLAGVFAQVLMAVMGPVIGAIMQLVSAVLPPLVMILQNVIIPMIQLWAQLVSQYLAFVITNVLIPALQFLMPIITWLANLLGSVLAWAITNVIIPAIQLLVAMFQGIGAAATWLWTNVLQPTWTAIQVAWTVLVAGMQWAWNNILRPVFDFIGLAAQALIAVILTVLITPLMIAWNLLMDGMQWAWQNVLLPCWQAIQAAASWLWTNVLQPVFAAIGAAWDALMAGVNWVWLNILKPCWDAIIAALNWLYLNVWLPIMAGLQREWQMLMDAINWVWLNILKPCWDAIIAALNWLYTNVWLPILDYLGREWQKLMDLINWVWLNVLKPCWDAVAGGLTWLRDRFNDAVNWIGDIWNRMRALMAKPINFLINTVWNDGIRPAWNAVAKLVGLGDVGKLAEIPEAASGGIPYPNRYTPGRDIGLAAVSGGEAVMRPEWTRAMGTDYVNRANAAARSGGVAGVQNFVNTTTSTSTRAEGDTKLGLMRRYPLDNGVRRPDGHAFMGRYAFGGVVPYVADAGFEVERLFGRMPGGIGGKAPRGNVSDHPTGHALDFMTLGNFGLGDRVANHLLANAGRMKVKYVIWKQRINEGRGWQGMEDRGSVTANHYDHVHASFLGGPGGGGGGGWFNWIRPLIERAFNKFTNPAIGALDALTPDPPPEWNRVPVALATKMRDTLRDFLFAKSDEQGGGAGGGDVERWRPLVMSALQRVGQPGSLADITLRRMNQESSGNPRAINNWDSNALRGTPSKGLMQVIDPTFRANRDPGLPNDIWDPMANVVASMRYALSRYGSLSAAYGRKGGYDQGGLAIGKGLMLKQVMAPERVLSPVQTRDYDTLSRTVRMLDVGGRAAQSVGDGTDRPVIENLYVTAPQGSSASDMAQAMTWEVRKARRGGVHAGTY